MASDARQYELVLLGATGYTGKLTAEWISTHLPADLKWAIAGRNAKKLHNIVDELKELNPDRPEPAIETCELEKSQLTTLAQKTRLIINTIGPFMYYGEPVLSACAETGTHYLDCTGEVPWLYDMISKYHSVAQKSGAIIIPQCGLDSVPADIMTFALSNHIRKTLHTGTASIVLSLYDMKSGFSGGTSLTMLDLFNKYPLKEMGKRMSPYALSPVPPTNPSRPPMGSFWYRLLGLLNMPDLGGVQTAHIMATADTCIVHRSWGLYSSNPSASYGAHFRFVEYMRAKSALGGALFKLGVGIVALFLAFPPTRWILSPLIKRFVIPKPGEGPSKESMKNDFTSYRALGTSEKGDKVLGKLDCPHGGYAMTALTLGTAAEVILRGRLEETEAGRLGGGMLTPAMLGEQYVERLNVYGMKIQVGV